MGTNRLTARIGVSKMKLGRFTKIFVVVFGIVLLTVIIDNFARGLVPVASPVYWIAAAIEMGLGYLTYWFWMRSILVKGLKLDRIMVIVLIVLGFALPNVFYLAGFGILNPAGSTDLYYYLAVIILTIYSSYTIDRYLAVHGVVRSKEDDTRLKPKLKRK
jgi:drug/metabolite transporter (DMT)-like permease